MGKVKQKSKRVEHDRFLEKFLARYVNPKTREIVPIDDVYEPIDAYEENRRHNAWVEAGYHHLRYR